jgi:hypothetical protein
MEVFWIGSDGSVQDRYFYDGAGWKGFTLAPAGSASTTGGIAVISRSSNTMEVFWAGPDGSVQDRYFYDGAGWKGFTLAPAGSASTTAGIAAVSRSSNTMEVFWAGPDGSVQDRYFYDGAGWKGFTLAAAGSASTTGGIAAISRMFNTMEIFWTGPDGSVEDRYFYDGAGWKGFTLAAAGSASTTGGIAALSRDFNCMGVWWIGPDGHVQDANWNKCEAHGSPNAWNQWQLALPGSASTTSGIAAVSRSDNTIEVFWIAPDGHVQDAFWYWQGFLNQEVWNQFQLAPPGSAPRSAGLAAVSRTATSMEMWWSGADYSIQDNYWYGPEWTERYPRLAPFGTINYPWLVLKCTLSDNRDVPEHFDSIVNNFLTQQGAGTGNITDYYTDVSYGAITFAGTKVYGWYPAPFNGTEPGIAGASNRFRRVQACADAIPPSEASKINFWSYWGIIMVTNHQQDGGACYDGRQSLQIQGTSYSLACVILDAGALYTAFAGHELGHGLGMPHSWNNTPCEYCDPFDLMSALVTYQFDWPNYPSAGPGLNVPNLLFLGNQWPMQNTVIPLHKILTFQLGGPRQTVTLAALSHPFSSGALTVELIGNDPNDIYTVEYRQADGWDRGLPNNGVLIHEYKIGSSPYSYLQGGMLLTNTQWVDPKIQVGVWVCSTNPSIGTAVVSIGPPTLFSTCP